MAKPQEVRELYYLKRFFSHTALAIAEGALIALLVVGLIAGTAFAARGGGGGGKHDGGGSGGSITMTMADPADTSANHGDRIGFAVSTSNAYPVASLTCSQGGSVVYGDSRPMYWPNIWNDPGIFTLSSLAWTGGAADCRAELKASSKNRIVTLATTTFHVDP